MAEAYQDLENVDVLAIANSSMNLLQEIQHLKDHNTQVANNIKEELRNDFDNSLQALQVNENIENLPPQYYIPNQYSSMPNTSSMTDYNSYMVNIYSPPTT